MAMTAAQSETAEQQRRTLACAVLSGIFLIAAVVLSRRVSGDLSGLGSEWLACGAGAACLAITAGCLAMSGQIGRLADARVRLPVVAGCLLPSLVLGLTLMPTGSSQALAVLLSIYATTVIAFHLPDTRTWHLATLRSLQTPVSSGEPDSVDEPDVGGELLLESELHVATLPVEGGVTHPADCPDTTHWMSRSVQDGCDVVEGAFRVEFASGQRQVAIHLPFAPALPSAPDIECEPVDGDADVRIRVTSAEAWGVRIEVARATDLDQQQAVQLGYFASAALSQSAAAA